ncbi:TLC domain-containing protein 2-like [Sander vitreus]
MDLKWKWRNISTSLSYRSLTGAWAVSWCFLHSTPDVEDLIFSLSLLSYSHVAVSTGYFIHDFLDVASNQSCKQPWEVLLHHSHVLSCFSLAVTSRVYVGYSVVSLLVEINSVFIRQLLLLSGRRNRLRTNITGPCPSVIYSVTSWLNLGTLSGSGILLWRFHKWNMYTRMPRYILMMGTAGLSLISTINIVLFYRLLRADILTSKGDH